MFINSHNRFFPTPHFLAPPLFGLDISDESIKFAELIPDQNGLKVGKYGEIKIETGIIKDGKINNLKAFSEILSKLRKEYGVGNVCVSLPENQIYLFNFNLEKRGLKNIREGVELNLEQHVPITAEEAIFDYELISEDNTNFYLEVTVVSKKIVEDYLAVFKNALISVFSFELGAQAIARAVIKKDDLETYMIVNFEDKQTVLSIVSSGVVMMASTLDMGGNMLTSIIEKNFNISFEEAEKMKNQYGLQRNSENKEMFSVLLNGVSILRDEIFKHFLYWHTNKDINGKDNPSIKKIIICGGEANLIGLSEYLSVSMKTTVELGNVWVNMKDTEKYVPEIDFKRSLSFATALGLALRNF